MTSSHEQMIEKANALLPVIKSRSAAAIRNRQIPTETIHDLHEAGIWKLLQPSRFGGSEAHPNTLFEIQTMIATACPSTAWVLGVVAVHSWQLALFDDRAQQEVWGENPRTLISSSYAPTGKVMKVEGGYRLSGRWSFSSGSAHCGWAFLGAFVPVESGPPDMRTFLLPRSDYRIEDVWHTIALQGTGSNDIVVEDVFVPEYRTHKMSDGFKCQNPGNLVNPSPLYRLPFGQVFPRSVSTTAIGIAQGALDFYRQVTATKVGAADGNRAVMDPDAQLACAKAASAIDQARLVLKRNFDEMMDLAERGEKIPVEKRVAWRWDSTEVVSRCVEVVDSLFTLCGGRAIFSDSPMQRYFLDIHGARAHYANRPESPGRNFGAVQLGLPTKDFFI